MELALCSTCQLLRRAGKRFVATKISNTSNVSKEERTESLKNVQSHIIDQSAHFILNKSEKTKLLSKPSSMTPNILYGKTFSNNLFSKVQHFSKHCTFKPLRYIHTVIPTEWIDQYEIEDVLKHAGLAYKKRYTGYLTSCTSCCNEKAEKQKLKLFINSKTGDSICTNCGVKYDWKNLKKYLLLSHPLRTEQLKPMSFNIKQSSPGCMQKEWNESLEFNTSDVASSVSNIGNLTEHTLNRYCVRKSDNNKNIIFPFYDITKKHVNCIKLYDNEKDPCTILKEDDSIGLFGWNTIEDCHSKVILTSNELDCLAVAQATNLPSLALPFGASTLPPDCLPYLEQFDDIILWFGCEYQAKQNLHRFAAKLGLSRCSFISSDTGGLVVLNQNGSKAVNDMLEKVLPMSHDHIVTFKELRNEVFGDLVNAKQNAGVPFVRFPVLNEYLKGHRRGELTVFTGPTGSGKTTFLSELSVDLCMQGVRTLWGSFEIKNIRLANTMLHQFSGIKLENHLEKFSFWCEEFEDLPMYFMNYYGATELKQVLETIKYAVYTYDIEHVIIDNLQFMTTVDRGEDRFQLMDKAISSFRSCASDHNVHITVVVHPRKENEGSLLQTASIYGSAKASQEADNVLILQNSENLAMQVSKNRFSGAIGTIPLSFYPESLCLSGFHRNVDTNEPILPALKVKRPIQNLKVARKPRDK